MINNIELIKPLLKFENEGDFYHVRILKRKKDQTTDKANHQSSRTIKTYCISSIEELEKKYEEIVKLSELFKARVYIGVSRQNHKEVGLAMIRKITERLIANQHQMEYIFDSVVDTIKKTNKVWVIDIDDKEISPLMIQHIEYGCRPITEATFDEDGVPKFKVGPKIITTLPTKNGFHILTKPFDLEVFKKSYPSIDVLKQHITLLYFPNSLMED